MLLTINNAFFITRLWGNRGLPHAMVSCERMGAFENITELYIYSNLKQTIYEMEVEKIGQIFYKLLLFHATNPFQGIHRRVHPQAMALADTPGPS